MFTAGFVALPSIVQWAVVHPAGEGYLAGRDGPELNYSRNLFFERNQIMTLFFRQLTRCFRSSSVSTLTTPAARTSKTVNVVKSRPPRRKLHAMPAYVLVVDESSSTAISFRTAFGRTTTRIKAIQLAAQGYLQHLKASNYRQLVAVVGFSDRATLYHSLAPVGRAMPGLSRALQSLHPQSTTNLSAGLDLALGQIRKAHTTRGNIVVITDGAANEQTGRLPGLVRQAKSSGVRIFTIGVGNNGDTDYDQKLLTHLARSTRGRFMSAHSFKALCNALRKAC